MLQPRGDFEGREAKEEGKRCYRHRNETIQDETKEQNRAGQGYEY
jgi:hypothetical protein